MESASVIHRRLRAEGWAITLRAVCERLEILESEGCLRLIRARSSGAGGPMVAQILGPGLRRLLERETGLCDEEGTVMDGGRRADELLRIVYDMLESRESVETEHLVEATGWSPEVVWEAVDVLVDGGLLKDVVRAAGCAITIFAVSRTARGWERIRQMSASGDETGAAAKRDPRKVFVVHGRDEEKRADLFRFLRALDLDPIEWHQAIAATGEGAPYVGQAVRVALESAQAVVVLMTPDDEARLSARLRSSEDSETEAKLMPQPRPNVFFEAGMAMALLPERTVFVEVGELRPWSDVAGRHVVRPGRSRNWRHDLAQRLRNAGCAVNTIGADWQGEGAKLEED